MMKVVTAITLMVLLAGCNTVQGIGRDIERGGEAIQRSTK